MKVSEVYASVQGEGPNVGKPTVFLRFAGCNLRCPSWPCDTQHAIDPEKYRDGWTTRKPFELASQVMGLAQQHGITNVCLTGGEPFLQTADELRRLCEILREEQMTIEVFTNGTITWPDWTAWTLRPVVDWKLAGSGEYPDRNVLVHNLVYTRSVHLSIKFTAAHQGDLEEAYQVWKEYAPRFEEDVQFFAGPVWGLLDPKEVVSFILNNKLPWRLNIQTHKYIWSSDERGV